MLGEYLNKGMILSDSIHQNENILKFVSKELWSHPELNFEEHFAHELLTGVLEKCGFLVHRNYFLPTAFRAEFCSERAGPTVAVMCEYDALPNIGHACGHNLIAEVAVATGIAVKAAIENDSSVCGKVVVLGTPAEEKGGGKIRLLEKGAFKDIDVAMMAHPQVRNLLYPLLLENWEFSITFSVETVGDVWESLNAVDAVVTCYNNVAVLRRSLRSSWRVSLFIPKCSEIESELCVLCRAPLRKELSEIQKSLEQCIRSAAEVTKCNFKINQKDIQNTYVGMVHNRTISKVFAEHVETKGIRFEDDDPGLCNSPASTDMGNVSHAVPSVHPVYRIGAEPPDVNHTAGFTTAAGADAAQAPTLAVAEGLAMAAVRLMSDPELLAEARREFENDPNRLLESS